MKLNLNIPDFDDYLHDQQFVNIATVLNKIETSRGGLPVEEIWNIALQVIDQLKMSARPDVKVQRLMNLIKDQLEKQYDKKDMTHTVHCILFCVDYILCANDEDPDPNQDVIDSLSCILSDMTDIRELMEAVTNKENDEWYRHGREVEAKNPLKKEEQTVTHGIQHDMTAQDKELLERIEAMAGRGCWTGGMTAELMKKGLRAALGIETRLDHHNHELSEKLWKLFQKRKGCDEKRSFMVTWLNIVGYCKRNALIEGASPTLINDFFDRYTPEDYKAIDKGKNQDIASFEEVTPLFDTFLKPQHD